ncbi:MAG TPA: hypothetical protein VK663_09665 [Burkholderiales bacterium]|nr:hypothetical protein [Burkholderiales bacterium]
MKLGKQSAELARKTVAHIKVMAPNPILRRPLQFLALVIVLLIYCITAPWQIRFSYVSLNHWAAATLAVSLPLSMLWIALRTKRKSLKIVGIVLSALVALPSLLFSTLALLESISVVENNVDRSFTLMSEGKGSSAYYRLYRSDCGATCSTDLVLRKEYDTQVGVKLVTQVWFRRHQSTGTIQIDDRGTIRVVDDGQLLASLQP